MLIKKFKPFLFPKISLYYKGSVGYISMRSPKDLNCLSEIMLKELSQAILNMHNDELVNVIVIVS